MMNVKLKWFIYQHCWTFFTVLFFITLALSVILYAQRADWKFSFTVIGILLSLMYFFQKQQLDETKFFKELFSDFNRRYDELNDRLNNIITTENTTKNLCEIEGAKNTLYDYFNLCGEEYFFYKKGFIYPEAWQAWIRGMSEYYKDERIQKLWKRELQKGSYYGFDLLKEMQALSP